MMAKVCIIILNKGRVDYSFERRKNLEKWQKSMIFKRRLKLTAETRDSSIFANFVEIVLQKSKVEQIRMKYCNLFFVRWQVFFFS